MSTKNIRNFIDVDIKYNMTPDLPYLRYYGKGIPVFLWDDLQDYNTLSTVLSTLDMKRHYESKFFNSLTMTNYVPWYNMDESRDSYEAYCLEEYDDLAFLDVPSYTMGVPLPMKGKLVNVSLEALQELDAYYENEHIFTRTEIKVRASEWSQTPIDAFSWFNNVDQISSFDNSTSEYVLDKNLDLTPFKSKAKSNGPEYYEM